MSKYIDKKIYCPECNEEGKVKIYTSVNVTLDPRLKATVMDGSIFDWHCHSCGYKAHLSYPLLYNDMKRKFMVYYVPGLESFCLADKALEEEYPELYGITKRTASDFNSFKEKIYIFDSGLDDMAVELCKQAISRSLAEKFGKQKITTGYFSMFNRENNSIGFTYFIGENPKPYLQSARLELYTKSARIANTVAHTDKERQGFLKIDREWADNIMYRYNSMKNI